MEPDEIADIREGAQLMAEGADIDGMTELDTVFLLAERYKVLPSAILEMDDALYLKWSAFVHGWQAGRNARA